MRLRILFFLLPAFFLACTPPVHLNKNSSKIVLPLHPKKRTDDIEKLHQKLSLDAKKEISRQIEKILKVQNGANPADLKPFDDNSIF